MERKIVELLLLGAGPNRISRELKISKRRLMMVRAKAEEAGYLDRSRALASLHRARVISEDSHVYRYTLEAIQARKNYPKKVATISSIQSLGDFFMILPT